jgi:hypothetical protein
VYVTVFDHIAPLFFKLTGIFFTLCLRTMARMMRRRFSRLKVIVKLNIGVWDCSRVRVVLLEEIQSCTKIAIARGLWCWQHD